MVYGLFSPPPPPYKHAAAEIKQLLGVVSKFVLALADVEVTKMSTFLVHRCINLDDC